MERKREFRGKIQRFMKDAGYLKRVVLDTISGCGEKSLVQQGIPEFEYRPSEEAMVGLIERAYLLSAG